MKNRIKCLSETISLIKRMDKHMTLSEANEYKESVQDSLQEYPHYNEYFNLDKIPMEILDKSYVMYSTYLFAVGIGHPLFKRQIAEGIDYKENIKRAKDILEKTFPIDELQFEIHDGYNNMYLGILISKKEGNESTITEAMNRLGFFQSRSNKPEYLSDPKCRTWVYMQFEPCEQDDVTLELRRKYKYVYHSTPSIFEKNIIKNGLIPSNSNPEFHYNEPRIYVSKGDCSNDELQRVVDDLYYQAKEKGYENLTPDYSVFIIDIQSLDDTIRFFYDINEPQGLFTKSPIPPSSFKDIKHVVANDTDKLSTI